LTDQECEHPHAPTLEFVLHVAQPFVVFELEPLRLVDNTISLLPAERSTSSASLW
jgi:hypothetical protein